MAPIDWDELMKLDILGLQDDTSKAEDLYCVLSDVCKATLQLFCYHHRVEPIM